MAFLKQWQFIPSLPLGDAESIGPSRPITLYLELQQFPNWVNKDNLTGNLSPREIFASRCPEGKIDFFLQDNITKPLLISDPADREILFRDDQAFYYLQISEFVRIPIDFYDNLNGKFMAVRLMDGGDLVYPRLVLRLPVYLLRSVRENPVWRGCIFIKGPGSASIPYFPLSDQKFDGVFLPHSFFRK